MLSLVSPEQRVPRSHPLRRIKELLFRWFLDMDMVEEAFNHSTFSKNRERLLEHDVAKKFLAEIVQ